MQVKWFQSQEFWFPFLAAIFFVVSAWMRIYQLSFESLWLDELMTYKISQVQSLKQIFTLRQMDFNPPLYDYFMRLTLKLFEAHTEEAIRFLSLIFGLSGLGFLFLVAKEFFGLQVATLALAIAGPSFQQVYYSREARPYSLIFLAVILFAASAIPMIQKARVTWKDSLAFAVTGLLLCYSHYGGLVSCFLICLAVGMITFIQKRNRVHLVGSGFLLLIGLLPWLRTLIQNSQSIPNWIGNHTAPFLEELLRLFQFTFSVSSTGLIFYFAGLLAYLGFCIWKEEWKEVQILLALNFLFLVPFLFVYGWLTWISPRGIVSRHLISVTPFAYLTVAYVGQKVVRRPSLIFALSIFIFCATAWRTIVPQGLYVAHRKAELRQAVETGSALYKNIPAPIVVVDFKGPSGNSSLDYYLNPKGLNIDLTIESVDPAQVSREISFLQKQPQFWLYDIQPKMTANLLGKILETHDEVQAWTFTEVELKLFRKKAR